MKKLFDSAPNGRPQMPIQSGNEAMDIAIIGMAGRIAGAPDLDAFWKDLLDGRDFITDFPENRKTDILDYIVSLGLQPSSVFFKPASFLPQVDQFDHGFFNISHPEAAAMSPEQRILLETTWHSLEDAGYAGDKIRGSRTGIYIGYARDNNAYMDIIRNGEPGAAGMAVTGNIASIMAGRIAHFLDLKGPTMLVNTACSSSLVALHQACRAILGGDCEMALVGGVNLFILPVQHVKASKDSLGVESSNGVARSFDDSSDGTGGGEGSIVLLLKPLSKALQDNDRIHAVIKGSAVNQDGRSINIASPNSIAQEDVIASAWKNAGIDPLTISYVETHGTGTPLGDPIEVAGLTAAFRRYTDRRQFCAIGALKSNIGHLDGAAGIAGLVKAILSLKHKTIVPSLHFEKPNRHIAFEDSPLYMSTRVTPWDTSASVRRCGISSFGISGTNAHVILEEAPQPDWQTGEPQGKWQLFVLSGTSHAALKRLAADHLAWLPASKDSLEDICYTSGAGRGHFSSRLALIAKDKNELCDLLSTWLQADPGKFADRIFECDTSTLKGNIAYEQQVRELSRQAAQWLSINAGNRHDAIFLEKLANLYANGAQVSWDTVYQHERRHIVQLPLYPFQPKRCWVGTSEKRTKRSTTAARSTASEVQSTPDLTIASRTRETADAETIFEKFRAYFSNAFDIPTASITRETNVYEIGLDSITIVQVRLLIKKTYGIEIAVIDIFRKYMKVWDLAEFIEAQLQLRHDEPAQQVELLPTHTEKLIYRPDPRKIGRPVSSIRTADADSATELTPAQQLYIDGFMHDFRARSAASLEFTRQHMPHFANNRNVSGFKKAYKQLHYTLFADRVDGSRIWDIDGNEYIDFAMGFGVFFMGHNHPLIREALEQQLTRGAWLGPLSCLAGEVAGLISEIAGVDRVAFYNSGTEAVMVAIRLARAATGRPKIVTFTGSYHGMFDGLLAQRNVYAEYYETVPLANGILQSMVDEVYVLEYDDPAALEFIKAHHQEIAAVLVEPVQSRKPDLQPREFLFDLRNITRDHSICLIFDEIITGFRIQPGGAQQYFNIKADLVTYGKVAGGGLPLGIVAGSTEFMMGIDGGVWDPAGDTLPRFDHRRTLVAGTFCHHPLALASAKAILQFLKREGQALYDRLNRITTELVGRLNDYFITEEVPIRLYNCGSMFHFRSESDLKLFFYHLVYKGIYVWEGATFFISTVHTEDDIARFEAAIKESIADLRQIGMMSPGTPIEQPGTPTEPPGKVLPLTNEQLKIWLRSQESPASSAMFNELVACYFQGTLNEPALEQALKTLIGRHESLRIRQITMDGQRLNQDNDWMPALHKVNIEKNTSETGNKHAMDWMRNEAGKPFPQGQGFVRAFLLTYGKDKHVFGLIIHQIIADGYSLSMIQSELHQLYQHYCGAGQFNLPVPERLETYTRMLNDISATQRNELLEFWSDEWKTPPPASFIRDPFSKQGTHLQRWANVIMPDTLYQDIRTMARSSQTTPFILLLAAHIATTSTLTGHTDIVTGIPSVGQLMLDNPCLVGQCMQMIPFRWNDLDGSAGNHLTAIRDKLSRIQEFRNFVVKDILSYTASGGIPCNIPEVRIVLNMDPPMQNRSSTPAISNIEFHMGEGMMAKYDLFINVVEVNKQLHFSFQYNSSLFTADEIRYWAITYFNRLQQLAGKDRNEWTLPSWGDKGPAVDTSIPIPSWNDLLAGRHASLREMLTTLSSEGLDANNGQLLWETEGYNGPIQVKMDRQEYYRQLAILADRLDLPAATNIWLLPGRLLPAEVLNWWWMALYRGWNLVVTDTPPTRGDAGSDWVICGDLDVLTRLQAYPDSFHWHAAGWIMIGSGPVSNLHLKDLPSLGNELRVQLITRLAGSAWYIFHNAFLYPLTNPVQLMPAGTALVSSTFTLVNVDGEPTPSYAPGLLSITDSNGMKWLTSYHCSRNGEGSFTIWSSGRETILYRGFTLDEQLLLRTVLAHPQVISAGLRREGQTGTILLDLHYKEGMDQLLDPLDYLRIFFPKHLLPVRGRWPQAVPESVIDTPSTDDGKAALLLDCVREVLKYPQASLQDSFLDLGGSSIQAIHLVTMIRNRMGIERNLGKLFRVRSLEELLLPETENTGLLQSNAILPAEERNVYPLSYTQKRFWVTEQLEAKVRTSSLVETRKVYGEIDEAIFYTACLETVNRHESLRTLFILEGSEPVQQILPAGREVFDYRFEDWQNDPDPLQRLQALRDEEMQNTFELDKHPALRIRLLRIGPAAFATILATHHIIFDGWSFDVLMKDIISAYKELLKGAPPFSRPLPVQLKDYCVWHNRLIQEKADQFKRYREKKFSDYPRPLTLARDSKRPPIKQQEAGAISLVIDRETTAALRWIGRSHNATMFMMVHSALLTLLHYYADETDITIGIPVAQRNHPDLQGLIGSLINTMAMRTRFRKTDSFLELLTRVRIDALEVFEQEAYPFDLLLSDINYPRDPSRNPLFDIGFTFHERSYLNEMPGVKDLGIRSEQLSAGSHSVMSDIWFNATLDQDALTFSILYDQAIYTDAFMTGLIDDLGLILRTVSTRPGITLQELLVRCKAQQIRKISDMKKQAHSRHHQLLQQIKKTAPLNK